MSEAPRAGVNPLSSHLGVVPEVRHASPVALVTGASRGIGRAIALRLAGEGYTVVANWARSADAAASLVAEIESNGGTCHSVKANVGSPGALARLVDEVRKLGRLDALVHNAALGAFKPVLATRPNQWSMTMAINAHALLELTRGLADLLELSKGSVISLTSHGSQRAIPNYGVIGVSKAALESLTRYLAVELGPRGVRVNSICAGWIDTDAVKQFPNADEMRSYVAATTPLRRMGEPTDIADVVLMLLGSQARWITGQVIVADGGESVV